MTISASGSTAAPPTDGGQSGLSEQARAELQDVARKGVVMLVGGVVSGLSGFFLTLVVSRGLGQREAGAFFAALAVFLIVTDLAKLGADTGMIRSVPRLLVGNRHAELSSLLLVALVPIALVACVCGAAMFAVAPFVAHQLLTDAPANTVTMLRIFACCVPAVVCLPVLLAGIRGFGAVRPLVLVDNTAIPLARILLMILVLVLLPASDAALAYGLPSALAVPVVGRLLWRAIRNHRSSGALNRPSTARPPLPRLAGEFWRFAGPRAVASVLQRLTVWLDIVLVAALASTTVAASYTAASRFVTAGLLGLSALRIAISPQIARALALNDRSGAEQLHQGATTWAVLSSWPLYLTLAVFAPLVLHVFGHGFSDAADALTILALGMLVEIGTGNVQTVLLMGGKSSWQVGNMAAALTTNIVLDLLLVPHLGSRGAALGWLAGILIDNAATVTEVHVLMGVGTFDRQTQRAALLALICFGGVGLAARLLAGPSWVSLAGYLVVAGACYGGACWFWRQNFHLPLLVDSLRRRPMPTGRSAQPAASAMPHLAH